MRVMLMIKGDPEPGAVPSEELLAAMGRYNDELKEAGLLVDLAGLLPSAAGRRGEFATRSTGPRARLRSVKCSSPSVLRHRASGATDSIRRIPWRAAKQWDARLR